MKDSQHKMKCCWAYKYEILGLLFLLLATILTLITFNSIGIAAMFFVGLVLCAHRCLCYKTCDACGKTCDAIDVIDESAQNVVKKTASKKGSAAKK